MAKKFGKILVATALIGTAVAGGLALYNKYKANQDDIDDDFMDFDDDFDDDFEDEDDGDDASRSYVNITYNDVNEDIEDAEDAELAKNATTDDITAEDIEE